MPGLCGAEGRQRLREQVVVGDADEADGELADFTARGALRVGRCLLHAHQDLARFLQEHLAGRREGHAPLRALEQARAQLLLQRLDLHRQRRLRQMQALRRPAEVQFFGDGHEVAQVAQLHRSGSGHFLQAQTGAPVQ